MVNFCSKGYFLSPVLLKRNLHVRPDTSCRKLVFLDALASLDLKLSVSEWVIYRFQLAHLRVFQSYLFLYSWGTFTSQYVWSTLIRLPPHISIWTFLHFLHLYFLYTWGAFTSYVWSTFMRLPPPVSTWTSTNRPTDGFLCLQCCIPTTKPSCN